MQEKGTANREAPTKAAPTTQREGGSEHSPPPPKPHLDTRLNGPGPSRSKQSHPPPEPEVSLA